MLKSYTTLLLAMPLLMIATSLTSCGDVTKPPTALSDFCTHMNADGGFISYNPSDESVTRVEKLNARYVCQCEIPRPVECPKDQ